MNKNSKGFTLFELILTIFLIALLTGIALPKYFRLVETVRGNEAGAIISTIRKAMESCYAWTSTFTTCYLESMSVPGSRGSTIGMDDPERSPNAHFYYQAVANLADPQLNSYYILASRNTRDGGDPTHWIRLDVDFAPIAVTWSINGPYKNLQ